MSKRLALVLVAAPGLAAAGACVPEVPGPVGAGDVAPPFSAVALDGAEFRAADLLGAPYMLNVWATWCAPCRHEMPELQELHDAYAPQGFQVVGVSVDDRGAADLIQAFLDETGVTFPILHDPSSEIMYRYGLLGLPGSFLVDADGVVARKWAGQFRPMAPDVQESVRALLAGPSGS